MEYDRASFHISHHFAKLPEIAPKESHSPKTSERSLVEIVGDGCMLQSGECASVCACRSGYSEVEPERADDTESIFKQKSDDRVRNIEVQARRTELEAARQRREQHGWQEVRAQ